MPAHDEDQEGHECYAASPVEEGIEVDRRRQHDEERRDQEDAQVLLELDDVVDRDIAAVGEEEAHQCAARVGS